MRMHGRPRLTLLRTSHEKLIEWTGSFAHSQRPAREWGRVKERERKRKRVRKPEAAAAAGESFEIDFVNTTVGRGRRIRPSRIIDRRAASLEN